LKTRRPSISGSAARGSHRGEETSLCDGDRPRPDCLARQRPGFATLKRAQDLLGRIHDLEVLIARTRAIQGSSNAPTLRVSADMDLLVRRLETECRRLHGRYIAMRAPL
jgi:hypothetical protein